MVRHVQMASERGDLVHMGRRPLHSTHYLRALALACALLAGLLLAVSNASGKKPPWAQGNRGSQNGGIPALTQAQAAAPASEKDHGKGKPRGKAKRQYKVAPGATPSPQVVAS